MNTHTIDNLSIHLDCIWLVHYMEVISAAYKDKYMALFANHILNVRGVMLYRELFGLCEAVHALRFFACLHHYHKIVLQYTYDNYGS